MSNPPEQVAKVELECALGSIRGYAYEHKLTGEQIGKIFDIGIAACAAANLYGLRDPAEAA